MLSKQGHVVFVLNSIFPVVIPLFKNSSSSDYINTFTVQKEVFDIFFRLILYSTNMVNNALIKIVLCYCQ